MSQHPDAVTFAEACAASGAGVRYKIPDEKGPCAMGTQAERACSVGQGGGAVTCSFGRGGQGSEPLFATQMGLVIDPTRQVFKRS